MTVEPVQLNQCSTYFKKAFRSFSVNCCHKQTIRSYQWNFKGLSTQALFMTVYFSDLVGLAQGVLTTLMQLHGYHSRVILNPFLYLILQGQQRTHLRRENNQRHEDSLGLACSNIHCASFSCISELFSNAHNFTHRFPPVHSGWMPYISIRTSSRSLR